MTRKLIDRAAGLIVVVVVAIGLVVMLASPPVASANHILPAIQHGTIAVNLNPVATGMAAPDYAISPPGDTNRLFVVEQNGLLRLIQNGALQPGAALDLQSRVSPPFVPRDRKSTR